MAVLGREHLDIQDLNADSLTLSRSLDPLELFFDIPRAPLSQVRRLPPHLVVQNRLCHRHPGASIKNTDSKVQTFANCD